MFPTTPTPTETPTSTVPPATRRAWRLILTLLALIMAGLCLRAASQGQYLPGLPFHDPDDVMRMLQVLALYDGGDWYDLTQPRINPPTGLAMHWSRLPDLPLLGVLSLTAPWLGRDQAILVTLITVPMLLGVAYFLALVWAARPLTGLAGGPLAGLIVLVAAIPQIAFQAGRVDHHGWQLLLAILVASAVLRLAVREYRPWPAALLGGGSAALGLWVGAEAIPVLAFAAAALTLVWWREGRRAADHLALLGLSALMGTLLILPLALPPGGRASTACDAFSLVSVALAAAVALFGLGAALTERLVAGWLSGLNQSPRASTIPGAATTLTPGRRLLVTLVLGLPLLGLLGLLFPSCLAGPYGELGPAALRLVARTVESTPLSDQWASAPGRVLYLLALPLAALALLAWRIARAPAASRAPWLALLVLVAGGFVLPWWQTRGALLANAYATLALAGVAADLNERAGREAALFRRLVWRAGPILLTLLLPITAALTVAILTNTTAAPKTPACDLTEVLAVINQPAYRARAPLLIAAPGNHGPALLWGSSHAVLAAPYHRIGESLQDNLSILEGERDKQREVVDRRGGMLVIRCPDDGRPDGREADKPSLEYLPGDGDFPDWLGNATGEDMKQHAIAIPLGKH